VRLVPLLDAALLVLFEVCAVPKCVLLVDDSPIIRSALRTMVESAGIDVCGEAEDGAQAIEKAKQLKPDLIVLDLCMPIMNGLQAAPVLKSMLPKTPIILFTLYADSIVEHEAFAAGVSALVPKNEAISRLIDEANTLLKSAPPTDGAIRKVS